MLLRVTQEGAFNEAEFTPDEIEQLRLGKCIARPEPMIEVQTATLHNESPFEFTPEELERLSRGECIARPNPALHT